MKINKYNIFVCALFFWFELSSQAQTKQWTLEECVQYAHDNNISIKLSEQEIKNAAITEKEAFDGFLPSVNGNASHSWNVGLNQDLTTGILRNQTTQYSSIGLNANVDIYKGLQRQYAYRKAKLATIASQYQLKKIKEDISLNIANAFLEILFNKENLKIKKEQLIIDQKRLERSEKMINSGNIPRGDLYDLKASVAIDQQNIVMAENNLLISKLSLAQLLQLKDFENFDIIDQISATDKNDILSQSPTDIYNKAKETRVEIKLAKANLDVAQKNIAIARKTYQPTLIGFYSFNTRASYRDKVIGTDGNGLPILAGPDPVFQQFNDNKGHNFGFQLNVPIFNGLSARNNVDRNKINFEKSKIDFEQKNLELQRNVYSAFANAKGALNAYESAITTLEARQQAYNYAKEKYDVGLMNSFDFTQTQTLLTNSQSEAIRAKYDYIFKIKILEFYFGIPISETATN